MPESGEAPVEQQPINPEGLLRKNQELLEERKKERELRIARERALLELKYPGISLDGVEDLPFDKADALLSRARETFAAPPAAPPVSPPPPEPSAAIKDWQTLETAGSAAASAPQKMTYLEAVQAGKTPAEIIDGFKSGLIPMD